MLLAIKNLSIHVSTHIEKKVIVDDVSFNVGEKRVVALVGGSGSGKTTIGLSILGLLSPELRVTKGAIFFKKRNLRSLPEGAMRILRGKEIGMVFQEPLNAFNPVFRIGNQIDEVVQYHLDLSSKQRKARVLELLDIVGMKEPKIMAKAYPHQLSGGMRQRAMIAQAIAGNPSLLIADEPTSNLDVTLQARIMDLFKELKDKINLSVLLITHDLGVVQHLADDVVVMKEGQVVESGMTESILTKPGHEYTKKLMEAIN